MHNNMKTKADTVEISDVLNFYRNKAEQMEYSYTIEKMVNKKYQSLLQELVNNHPELEKEVMGDDGTQAKSGPKQK